MDQRLLLALLAIVCALLVNALVYAAPECHPASQVYGTEYHQNHNDGASLVGSLLWLLYSPFCAIGSFILAHKEVIDGLSTFVVAVFTVVLAWSTVRLWRETERLAKGADDQSTKMASSIAEAARAATAMEGVSVGVGKAANNSAAAVGAMKDVSARQMRAYLSVEATTIYTQHQATRTRFEIALAVANTGFTPAHNVVTRFNAEIFPHPVPGVIDLTIPEPPKGTGVINPRQAFGVSCIAVALYPEEIVWQTIDPASPIRLYVYGTVWYDDIFGERHHINYCQWILWKDAGMRVFINSPRHNDSN